MNPRLPCSHYLAVDGPVVDVVVEVEGLEEERCSGIVVRDPRGRGPPTRPLDVELQGAKART